MSVTAKVKVYKSPAYPTGDPATTPVRLDFTGDYSDGRNQEWSVATPVINLVMYVKPEVAEKFENGASYVLTFDRED